MSSKPSAIYWFRQDLRLADNPALYEATQTGSILAIYILDDVNPGDYSMGEASRFWLHHSLTSLAQSLNQKISFYRGNPLHILVDLCQRYEINKVFWNRCYEPWQIQRDKAIKAQLQSQSIQVNTYNGSLLWEPWQVKKTDGTPYKVFTPFYRKGCLNAPSPREPLSILPVLRIMCDEDHSLTLDDLNLLPKIGWDKKIHPHWHIGEAGAQDRWDVFLSKGLGDYKEGRNYPARLNVSRLSPSLHFGEISPNQLWYQVRSLGDNNSIDCFCSELGWREFSYSLLYYNPTLPYENLQVKFNNFPWQANKQLLQAWQKGETGIPMVDAGMRELWLTGYIHNRVRMIVGSFLVKNLRLDWRDGERWFWDCLVDADLANNSASWQWIAGCGADAAPYFRIFNPISQGEKFDPEGHYLRQYLPELSQLPLPYLFNPSEAPLAVLKSAGVILGKTYPRPIVDLKKSREEALLAYKGLSL